MTDIAPELLEKIKKDFYKRIEYLKKAKVNNYEDAYSVAGKTGEALAKSFGSNITAGILPNGIMHYNIADRVVRPMLEENYKIAAEAAVLAQTKANKAAKIGIKAHKAVFNEDRAQGIVDRVSSQPFDEVKWILNEPVKTFSRSVVDETLELNVEFQGKSGLEPKIVRTATTDACPWCLEVAGTYSYPDVPNDVYRRHANCDCIVEYVEAGKYTNVHTKKAYNSKEERAEAVQDKTEKRYFKDVRFKSPISNSDIEWLEKVGGIGTSTDITSRDISYVRNNVHIVSNKENIGKVVSLSSMDYVYAIEMNDFADYNILWKIPNDDNLNDAIALIKGRRK